VKSLSTQPEGRTKTDNGSNDLPRVYKDEYRFKVRGNHLREKSGYEKLRAMKGKRPQGSKTGPPHARPSHEKSCPKTRNLWWEGKAPNIGATRVQNGRNKPPFREKIVKGAGLYGGKMQIRRSGVHAWWHGKGTMARHALVADH